MPPTVQCSIHHNCVANILTYELQRRCREIGQIKMPCQGAGIGRNDGLLPDISHCAALTCNDLEWFWKSMYVLAVGRERMAMTSFESMLLSKFQPQTSPHLELNASHCTCTSQSLIIVDLVLLDRTNPRHYNITSSTCTCVSIHFQLPNNSQEPRGQHSAASNTAIIPGLPCVNTKITPPRHFDSLPLTSLTSRGRKNSILEPAVPLPRQVSWRSWRLPSRHSTSAPCSTSITTCRSTSTDEPAGWLAFHTTLE